MSHLLFLRVAGAIALLVSLPIASIAQTDEAVDALGRKMADAYRNTDTYQAKINFEVTRMQGRWRLIQTLDVVVDKPNNSLRIDRPDLLTVADGSRLYTTSEMAPGRYLNTAQPTPLDYKSLLRAVPFLTLPPLPGVALMLGHDPIAAAESVQLLDADPADGPGRPRLVMTMPGGVEVTYLVDPIRHLVTGVRWQQGEPGRTGMRGLTDIAMDIEIVRHNQPLDAGSFAFDPGGAQAVGSVSELMSRPNQAPPANASSPKDDNAGDDDGTAMGLIGRPAPALRLKDLDGVLFDIEKVEADVIVLDFWAIWCGPCVQWLPLVDEIDKWARKNNKSVAVVAVNLEDDPAKVKAFWRRSAFTIPTLLDTGGQAATAYRVESIPQTVIISGGKVQDVHVGGSPRLVEQLKKQIEALQTKPE